MAKNRPLFIASADWHLQPAAWKLHPQIRGDAYAALRALTALCLELKPHWLFCLGDLYDVKYPDPVSVKVATDELAKIHEAGVKIGYIQGQHESHREQAWLGINTFAQHLHHQTIDVNGFAVYGLDWTPRGKLPAEFAAMAEQPVDILLAHQVWQEHMDINHEAAFTQVPRVTAIFTGDYHVPLRTKFTNATGQRAVAYSPGSLASQDISEPWQKQVYVVRKDKDKLDVEATDIPSRRILRFSVFEEAELETFTEVVTKLAAADYSDLPEEIRTPIVEVRFAYDIPHALSRITAACRTGVHLMAKPVSAVTEHMAELTTEKRDAIKRKGLRGGLETLIPKKTTLRFAVQRLLDAVDPVQELAAMREEFLAEGLTFDDVEPET